jgi:hypothetical protein
LLSGVRSNRRRRSKCAESDRFAPSQKIRTHREWVRLFCVGQERAQICSVGSRFGGSSSVMPSIEVGARLGLILDEERRHRAVPVTSPG